MRQVVEADRQWQPDSVSVYSMSPPLPCQYVTARVGFCESNKAPSNALGQLRKGSQATVVTAVLGQTQHQRQCATVTRRHHVCVSTQHSVCSWFLRCACASAVIGQPGPGSLPSQAAPMGHQPASSLPFPFQSNRPLFVLVGPIMFRLLRVLGPGSWVHAPLSGLQLFRPLNCH